MICRVGLLTVLLGSGFVLGRLLHQPIVGSDHFYLLIGVGYCLSLLYAILHPVWSHHPASAYVQVAGDIALITGFVYVTGGIDSPFSPLYFLSVISASILLGRAGATSSAAGAWVLYCFLVVLIVYGKIPEPPGATTTAVALPRTAAPILVQAQLVDRRAAYSLFSHFLGFLSVALLSSYLTSKLKATGEELQVNREALANVQALNKNIVDSITSGIITTDVRGLITFINRGGEEIVGRRLDEVAGTSVESCLSREEGFFAGLTKTLERERRCRFEGSLETPRGTTLFLGFSSAVLKDQRGEPMGYIFSFQDLTDIKALEEEVQLKARMAALGHMAAGMAHEIRNPLASMSGSVQILKKSLRPSAEEGELLDIVLRESKRLDGIIRDFLLFARPGRFRPEAADLVPLLRDSMTLLRNSEELGPSHKIEIDGDPECPLALVDVNMIKQVFWNLAKNALKAMPRGGTLKVRVAREGRDSVVASFSDQGIGMSEEDARRVFEPFHGGFPEGTGLGLSVVFRIVQEHRGRIRVKSQIGAGTEVLVSLPASPRAERGAWRHEAAEWMSA
ncbi:MAG TPA: ATP-binding protein, partial [Candidatus Polarisedimenticolia bacterium]|nr:ATP-binding protein [Candidatus Polarisedimenticolia bacterium]